VSLEAKLRQRLEKLRAAMARRRNDGVAPRLDWDAIADGGHAQLPAELFTPSGITDPVNEMIARVLAQRG
jgi:hypothetical protein